MVSYKALNTITAFQLSLPLLIIRFKYQFKLIIIKNDIFKRCKDGNIVLLKPTINSYYGSVNRLPLCRSSQLPVAFRSVMGLAQHLTITFVGRSAFTPSLYMVGIHFR